jgi:hypothetical protein
VGVTNSYRTGLLLKLFKIVSMSTTAEHIRNGVKTRDDTILMTTREVARYLKVNEKKYTA